MNALRTLGFASLVTAPALCGFADDVKGVKLEAPARPGKNRFGVSYRAGFNITAQFNNIGNINETSSSSGRGPGPATGTGVNRDYDDGYNRSINGTGFTWNWAYRNEGQIQGDQVVMSSTTISPIDSKTYDNDPQHGFEITYNRELGRSKNGKVIWGLEGGFGWTDIDIHDRRALGGGVRVLKDYYNLLGNDPQYNQIPQGGTKPNPVVIGEGQVLNPGTPEGPGPIIEEEPTRREVTSDPNGSTVRGVRSFDADLFSFRVGPYVDLPLDERWTISLSAGFAMGVIDGEFQFDQTVTTPGGTSRQVGKGGNTDVLFGGFASASIHYRINECWGAFMGGQYLGLADRYRASARGQEIELDLARTAFWSLGLTYSF